MSFATIEEAWGVSSLSSGSALPPTVPVDQTPKPVKDPWVPTEVSNKQPTARDHHYVRNFIDMTYQSRGISGVLSLLNRQVMNDLRMTSFLNPSWLSMNQLLGVLLVLFAMVVLLDVLK